MVFRIRHKNTGLLPGHLILLDVTRQMKNNCGNCETNDCSLLRRQPASFTFACSNSFSIPLSETFKASLFALRHKTSGHQEITEFPFNCHIFKNFEFNRFSNNALIKCEVDYFVQVRAQYRFSVDELCRSDQGQASF